MDPGLQLLLGEGNPDDEVAVILRLADPTQVPEGARIVARFGRIATCRLRRGDILAVRERPAVISMKAAKLYGPTPADMPAEDDASAPGESDQRRPLDLLETGAGGVIGLLDWFIDFTHPDFRNRDGSTRLLAIWDQHAPAQPRRPNRYGYGVIHTEAAINRALRTEDPCAALGYPYGGPRREAAHGTHTASIAAGGDRAGGPTGIAPGARIAFADFSTATEQGRALLGDSVACLEALDFFADLAGDRWLVINASIGRQAGPKDGLTLTEQGMDAFLLEAPGRAIVQSAGNYFDRGAHAAGVLRPGGERLLRLTVAPGARVPTEIDLWYPGTDRFGVLLRGPAGVGEVPVLADLGARILQSGRDVGRAYHRIGDPNNGDNQVTIVLDPGASAGSWEILLSGTAVADGRFHAWIERSVAPPSERSRFDPKDVEPTVTLGTICTGLRTIAVGAYDAHAPGRPLAPFSSCGPSRDGRPKPDLVAPGMRVLAARSGPHGTQHDLPLLTRMSGSSMAAPHVAGTVALVFEAAGRRLPIDETRRLLLSETDAVPSDADPIERLRFGNGYLDIEAAVRRARAAAGSTVPALLPVPPRHGAAAADLAVEDIVMEEDAVHDMAEPGSAAWETTIGRGMAQDSDMDAVTGSAAEHDSMTDDGLRPFLDLSGESLAPLLPPWADTSMEAPPLRDASEPVVELALEQGLEDAGAAECALDDEAAVLELEAQPLPQLEPWRVAPDVAGLIRRLLNEREDDSDNTPDGAVAPGREVVERLPLLAAHRGTPPDLVLRWNVPPAAGTVIDTVVHLHGFSARGAAMHIVQHKEAVSGLDFANPDEPSEAGRSAPTIALLPRGNFYGGRTGAGYDFPVLARPGALTSLVEEGLQRLGRRAGLEGIARGRLIVTAHSGGGAALMRLLAHEDPDEIQLFDALYGDATALIRWAEGRIARGGDAALRVLYVPDTGTARQSERVRRALEAALPAGDPRARRFRVEPTTVAHGEIPRHFGWRLLADAGADLPLGRSAAPARRRTAPRRAAVAPPDAAVVQEQWAAHPRVHRWFDNDPARYAGLAPLYATEGVADAAGYLDTNIVTLRFRGRAAPGHRDMVGPLSRAETTLQAGGGLPVVTSFGCLVPRPIRGTVDRLSRHALGCAVDLDPAGNPRITDAGDVRVIDAVTGIGLLRERSPAVLRRASEVFQRGYTPAWIAAQTDPALREALGDARRRARLAGYARLGFCTMPEALIEALVAGGLVWGGGWRSSKDFMHFELP